MDCREKQEMFGPISSGQVPSDVHSDGSMNPEQLPRPVCRQEERGPGHSALLPKGSRPASHLRWCSSLGSAGVPFCK